MERLVAENIDNLDPYTPGEQPRSADVVKLNTNENPYPPSPKCAEALRGFDPARLRRYPDPVFLALRKKIARIHRTSPERVFVGNGSDEILALAAKAFSWEGRKIGSLDPSYSLYKTIAAIRGVEWTGDPGDKAVSLFLWTNPNAPTGRFAEPGEIAAFAKRFKGVVVVDEAYADFAKGDAMKLATAPGNRNIIVMRTFSKSYSLAGLRVGYCVGPEKLVEALFKIKDSYNVDALAQAVALAALSDRAWMKANAAKIRRTRRVFSKELALRGWDVIPSEANFVFAKPPAGSSAADVYAALRKRGIFTRYFPGPSTGDRLRISIGTDGEMSKLLLALDSETKSVRQKRERTRQ